MTMSHILSATDLSERALAALQRAALLASAHHARHTVVHCVRPEGFEQLKHWLGVRENAVSQTVLSTLTAQLDAQIVRLPLEQRSALDTRIEHSHPDHGLDALARLCGSELVVIGAHGGSAHQSNSLGTTASRVLRRSSVPVLIVRDPVTEPYHKVLIAVDFSPLSQPLVEFVRHLLPEATLVLMHAVTLPFEDKLRFAGIEEAEIEQYRRQEAARAHQQLVSLNAGLGEGGKDNVLIVVHGEPEQQIRRHAAMFGCDLIAMGKHGTHLTEELLLGSVTRHLLTETMGDLLVMTHHDLA